MCSQAPKCSRCELSASIQTSGTTIVKEAGVYKNTPAKLQVSSPQIDLVRLEI